MEIRAGVDLGHTHVTRPAFAFLCLQEHPWAREMLRRLREAGHPPALIVEERSAVADTERKKFLARLGEHPVAASLTQQAAESGIPTRTVADHRHTDWLGALRALDPDLVVLGGTRVLRGPLLSIPRDGVLNSHPGLLPECRGSASPAWSVHHDIPVGATTHFCDEGIDTGDLLLRRQVSVHRGMTYEDLCHATLVLAGALMAEALVAYTAGAWPALRRPQGASSRPTFKNAPPEILASVRRKLADGTYAHFVD